MVNLQLHNGVAQRPLREQSALHIAFGGCCTSLAEIRHKFKIGPANTAITLDLLGEVLMVTGAACLPGPTVSRPQSTADEAGKWSSMTADEQLAKLKTLMGMLTTPPTWRGEENRASAHKPMLPREMGPWDGRRNMPSCFGMLVILASYGFLTKASMLTASVQRMSAEPVAAGLSNMFSATYRYIAETLPNAFRYDSLPAWLRNVLANADESVHLMATRREFHGAIVIRLKDGRWVAVDPYMQNMATLGPHNPPLDRIAAQLMADPGAAVTILGQGEWREQSQLERELRDVRGVLDLAQRDTLLHSGIPLLRLPAVLRAVIGAHSTVDMLSEENIMRSAAATLSGESPDAETARYLVAVAQTSTN